MRLAMRIIPRGQDRIEPAGHIERSQMVFNICPLRGRGNRLGQAKLIDTIEQFDRPRLEPQVAVKQFEEPIAASIVEL